MRGYKFHFRTSVHFGQKRLSDSLNSFYADTLFSALIIEANKLNLDFQPLLEDMILSDAFPFVGEDYYLPKAYIPITSNVKHETDYKIFKKLSFIPISEYQTYLNGELSSEAAKKIKENFDLGEDATQVKVNVDKMYKGIEKDSKPYVVGTYTFHPNAGLYVLVDASEATFSLLESLLESLQYSGIGGKRTSGYGQFTYECLPDEVIQQVLKIKSSSYLLLSGAMAEDEELENVCVEARYKILKRSGFVQSSTYADQLVKRNDYYVFSAGSTFHQKFAGKIFDMSENGHHPVYRYAKGFWIGGMH
ncbi:type III-A CRISPR-associated RAMP protein Csm4 [Enterococcus cecorum]|uniref:type III-A CRISPR-associated RAMP protein Csm4 n=1 Tax=Enterococcus cecorum TaxID=44008 RepID=UPI001FAD0C8E|nr:type III-A CRISPR-associated RAMP protein Csm4 [Enterococcus cecorum]MCJ0538337.1 type III-A CRISPR-associated RAMP protein Csm4 [Enterococcus cecorum]MCJ0546415.1 type III-A CRISPR-associated RAMP protein Csm4 [Enterococcus cecorum]MCJ0551888.1 type III-A CRISPR-associated RAMP protein Csm4 [Enterococcus cecorum]MCJ0570368.1 type III-A CRISPR-associated RAMP protein Csm4 [Enterococcus cecorum]